MAQKVAIKKTLGKKERWIYGELLLKRYAISHVLLETSMDECLPNSDENDERFVYEDGIPGTVGLYNCTDISGYYHWHLRNPKSLARPWKQKNKPQPV
jgi:hypothetical protein